MSKAFTRNRVEGLRPSIEAVATRLADAMERSGPPADLVADFAYPFSVTVICELLGVPTADRERFGVWADSVLSTSVYTAEEAASLQDELARYLAALVAKRRAHPRDDLLSDLVAARDNGDKLTESELVFMGTTLLIAGHETTASAIPNFVHTLLGHPDLLERLRADPTALPGAVEELMRYVPATAVDGFTRVATEDVPLAGTTIRAGETVIPSMGAANRDPRVFDHADTLDITRSPNPHLGFGAGVHHCLGAPLARAELHIALATLLARFPKLRGAVTTDDELDWKTGLIVRGFRSYPVTW